MGENLAIGKLSSDKGVQKINPYFSYDADTKQIQDLAFNHRGIIINERFWNRLRNELIDLLQDQGPLVLYQLGVNYGVEVGSQARKVSEDVGSAIKFFEYYGLLAGWGKLEMSEFEPIEGKLRVKIHENFFCAVRKIRQWPAKLLFHLWHGGRIVRRSDRKRLPVSRSQMPMFRI